VIAIDLSSGKQLWSKELQGLPPVNYPAYLNLMNLDADKFTVTITGHETAGDYIEVLDAATGKQIRHEVLPSDTAPAAKSPSTAPAIPPESKQTAQ
jgi:hypothetical protein